MAITATTVWEIRTTGLNTNGGGFDNLSPGVSVDYSQQDTPILTRSDFQKGTGANDITTAAGVACFTQAMIGNIICITTTALHFYQITTVSGDFKTITVDAAVAAGTGKTGSVGGAYKLGGANDQVFFTSGTGKTSGNVIHIKAGTYTLVSVVQANVSLILLGYNAARNDNPTGANRPVIDCTSVYYFSSANILYLHNLIFTGSGPNTITHTVTRCYGYNCKFFNTSTTVSNCIAYSTLNGSFVHCEFSSVKGTGLAGGRITVNCCYFHDGNTGITAAEANIQDCVFTNLSVPATLPPAGINITNASLVYISGCIFYACSNGIINTTTISTGAVIVNNIFSCLTGLTWYSTASTDLNIFDYNCYFCSVADVVNLSKGSNDITADPLFMYPLTNDFRLSIGSPCFNTGMQLGSIVGL